KSVIVFAALAFGVGAVAGVVGTKAISPPRGADPSTAYGAMPRVGADAGLAAAPSSSSPAVGPAPSGEPSTSPAVPAREGQAPRPLGPVPSGSSTRADVSPSTLARESEIIETGRAALARGRAADALAAADEHRRLFARGRLSEEREELAIRALRAAGRSDEARARAKAFLKAYPSSIYSGTVGEPAD
ncbi:MAG TPA: hypothetical protein VLT33_44735, partial [Labilithrix sp.]|nr:hypothetical protein [Labilithrix sp.]